MASKSRQRGAAGRKRQRDAEARRAADTAIILARKEQEIAARLEAKRIANLQLGGLGKNLTTREVVDITEALERQEAAARLTRRYMTEGPETAVHFTTIAKGPGS